LIEGARVGTAFTSAIVTTDGDGAVVNWTVTAGTFPAGLTLNSSTGAITGTPTAAVDYFFTVRITDNGGNTNTREFNLPTALFVYGGTAATSGGFNYRTFTGSGTLEIKNGPMSSSYLVVGGGGNGVEFANQSGGGGAGGLISVNASINSGIYTIRVGAGGSSSQPRSGGQDSSLGSISGLARGGGFGGFVENSRAQPAGDGGSGGGAAWTSNYGPGNSGNPRNAGQGFKGGSGNSTAFGGGGGSLEAGNTDGQGAGGDGQNFAAWASATGTGSDGCYAGGGAGDGSTNGGLGGGGGTRYTSGSPFSGGGGASAGNGGSGVVIVRWAI
jgi:hypothetical protein